MGGNFKDWRSWTKSAGEKVNNTSKNFTGNSKEFVEEIKVNGKNVVGEVERLLKESEVRRLRVRQGDRVLLDLPVAWAALGALLAPPVAAVGAIAAVATDCIIEVTRVVPADASKPNPAPAAAPAKPKEPAAARPTNPNPNPNIPKTPDDLNYR